MATSLRGPDLMLEQYPGRIEAIETTPDAPTANVGAPQACQMQQGSGGGRAVSSATDTVPAMSNCTAPVAGHRTEAGRRACPVHGANPAASAPLPPSLAPAPEPVSTYKRLERPDGTTAGEEWYVGDKLHRTDGPAVVWYRPDGTVEAEAWRVGGVNHRTDGPAYVRYYLLGGTVSSETWLAEGKRHRIDGPARVWYRPDGAVEREEWFVDGTEVEPWQVLGRYLTTRGVSGVSAEALKQIAKDVPWQRWSELGSDHPLVALWSTVHPSAEISAG